MPSDNELADGDGAAVNDHPTDVSAVTKVKQRAKTARSLTDDEYEAIFDAVFARFPPLDSQEEEVQFVDETLEDTEERIVTKKDDSDQINGNAAVDEEMEPENESDDISRAQLVQVANETTPSASDTENMDHDSVSRSPPKVRQKKKGLYSKRKKLSPNGFTFSKIPIEKLDDLEDDVTTTKNEKRDITKVKKRKPKPEFSKGQKMSRKSIKQTDTENKHVADVDRKTCGKVNLSIKQKMLERNIVETGTWVQCGKVSCLKWRYLPDVHDPSQLPNLWTCDMNQDAARNSCRKPEEEYDESEHVFTHFTEGSVVWARMAGYPWWPAMIEIDPDHGMFYECRGFENVATHYHVVFFDDKVSRAWLGVNNLNSFDAGHHQYVRQKTNYQGIDYKRRINDALAEVDEALHMSIPERLKTFTFGRRFSGRWGREIAIHGNKPVRRCTGQMSKKPTQTEVEPKDDLSELLDDVLMKNAEDVLEDLQFLSSPDGMDLIDSDYDPEAENVKRETTTDVTEKAGKRKQHKKRKDCSPEDVKQKEVQKETSLTESSTKDTKKPKKQASKKENSEKINKKEKRDKPGKMKKASSDNLLSKKQAVAKNEFAAPERNKPDKREAEKVEESGGLKAKKKVMKMPMFKPQKSAEKPKWKPVKKDKLKLDSDVFTMELDSQEPSAELLSNSKDKLNSNDATVGETLGNGCVKSEKKPKLPAFKAPNKKLKLKSVALVSNKTSISETRVENQNVETSDQDNDLVIDMDKDIEAPENIISAPVEHGDIDSDDSNPFEFEDPVIATLNKPPMPKTVPSLAGATNTTSIDEKDNELVIDMDEEMAIDIVAQDNINSAPVEDGDMDSDDSEPFEFEEPVFPTLNKLNESQDSPLFELEQ